MIDINDSLLQRLAGAAAFDRGATYFRDGRVGELRQAGRKVFADVEGNESYTVTLIHTAQLFEGSCTCPASDNIDFCKHCVAAAMHYRSQRFRREQQLGGSGADRLQAYLESLDKKELIDHLNEFIQADKVSFEAWSIRADQALDVVDFKAVRKRITTAIPYNRQIYRYAQVRAYFARVAAVMDLLADVSATLTPEQLLTLCDYALQRIARALDTIDDSGGYRFESLERLAELHQQAFQSIDWSAASAAEYLLTYFLSDRSELLPEALAHYLDAVPEGAQEQFEASLATQWQQLPAMQAQADEESQHLYRKLQAYMLQLAERQEDVDAAIEIKAKTAVETYDYLALFDYCLKAKRLQQAEDWLLRAEQGEKNRQYNTDILRRHRIELHEAKGEFALAVELQWQRFKQQPRLESYSKLLVLAGSVQQREIWQKKAQDRLLQQLDETKQGYGHAQLASLLIRIFLQEEQLLAALNLAEKHTADDDSLLSVARETTDQPERALALYMRVVDQCVARANNDSYQRAVGIALNARRALGDKVETLWQQQLLLVREKHKAKRNFQKFLDAGLAE